MATEPVQPDSPTTTAEGGGEPETSLAEHEAAFGTPGSRQAPSPETEPEPAAGDQAREPARDTKTGQFTKTPAERRPKSHQASPADVPRIAELTRKLREAEAERDTWKSKASAPPPATAVPAPTTRADVPPGPPAPSAPPQPAQKPTIAQFNDYDAYVEALADWKIAEARREDREIAAKEAARTKLVTSWQERTTVAKSKYPDFEQVALLTPTTIPQGSLVDAWILEHRSGADVLYSLQKDSAELQRILALPPFDQVEALSLLAQRLTVPSQVLAADTGAAVLPKEKLAPRPPTPVRTSATAAPDEFSGDEASLAEHEKYFGRKRQRG